MLFTPHAERVNSHSAPGTVQRTRRTDPSPATIACSATLSSRTTSRHAGGRRLPPSPPGRASRRGTVDALVSIGSWEPRHARSSRRVTPAAPASRTAIDVGLGRGGRGQPSTGQHQRRIAMPSWESNRVIPGGTGRSDSVIQAPRAHRGQLGGQRGVQHMVIHQRESRRPPHPAPPLARRHPSGPAGACHAPAASPRAGGPAGARPGRRRAVATPVADQVQAAGHREARGHRDAGPPPEPGAVGDHRPKIAERAGALLLIKRRPRARQRWR